MFCKLHHDIINQFILLKLCCFNQTPMFVGLSTEPKHIEYGSTNSLGNLICRTTTDNTPMNSLTDVFSCTKAHIVSPLNSSTKSHVSIDSPSHNLNVMTPQPTNVQQVLDLRPTNITTTGGYFAIRISS